MKRNPIVGDIIAVKKKQWLVVDTKRLEDIAHTDGRYMLTAVAITDADILSGAGTVLDGDKRKVFLVTPNYIGTEPLADVQLVATTTAKQKISMTYIVGKINEV